MVKVYTSGDGTGTYLAQASRTADTHTTSNGEINGDKCRVATFDNFIAIISHDKYDDTEWTELIARLHTKHGVRLGSELMNVPIRQFGPSVGIQISDAGDYIGLTAGTDLDRYARADAPGVILLHESNKVPTIDPDTVFDIAAEIATE